MLRRTSSAAPIMWPAAIQIITVVLFRSFLIVAVGSFMALPALAAVLLFAMLGRLALYRWLRQEAIMMAQRFCVAVSFVARHLWI